jgi:hypothetical protein
MQELKKVYDVLTSISSKKGFKVDKFTITAKSPVTAQITMSDGNVDIDFLDNTPVVTVRKIIRISISVLGITLMPSGGIIRLDNFPDMPFDYDEDGGIVSGLSGHFPGDDD